LGLLIPAKIEKNGYHYYDHTNLLQLQQVLFFRELDIPLQEIQSILSRPDFQLRVALKINKQLWRNS
jgi:DNA-binding transcriptional MerR regulator